MAHLLTEKNRLALTATCSECGPETPVAKAGRGFVCKESRRQSQRRWAKAHPERAREMKRRPPSRHRLEKRDGSADTCAVCGPVAPVVVGRGYGCPNRMKELGHTSFPLEPQPACPICKTFLDRFGACASCDNQDAEDLYIPNESRRHWSRALTPATREYTETSGFSVQEDPSWLSGGNESAVRGWKIIGQPVDPASPWYPEYLRLQKTS